MNDNEETVLVDLSPDGTVLQGRAVGSDCPQTTTKSDPRSHHDAVKGEGEESEEEDEEDEEEDEEDEEEDEDASDDEGVTAGLRLARQVAALAQQRASAAAAAANADLKKHGVARGSTAGQSAPRTPTQNTAALVSLPHAPTPRMPPTSIRP